MTGNKNISVLLNQNGCLSQSAIVKFIDRKLDEKELQTVLSHLDTCPLCKDAVEGISGTSPEQFNEDMHQLRSEFYDRSFDKEKKYRLRMISAISAAASVIVVIGVLFFYQRTRLNVRNHIAQSVEVSEEVKEKTKHAEESVPLNEAARPAQPEKEESPAVKSMSTDIEPLSDVIEEKILNSEAGQDILFTDAELPAYEQKAEPAQAEKSMELSEQKSVIIQTPSGTAARAKKKSESVMNTGLMQEKAAPDAGMGLPTRHVLPVTGKRLTFKGGDIGEFVNYIQDQLYTKDQLLKKTDIDSILVSFMVDTMGRPANIKVINQIDPEINRKIIRLFKSSPDWLPGKENGIMVNVEYTISVRVPPENGE